jgi:prevent-host-death family protein
MKANGNPRSEVAQPTIISSTTLQRQFGAILRRCYKDGEKFIVERDGLPVIAVLAVRDYERLMRPEPEDREDGPPER